MQSKNGKFTGNSNFNHPRSGEKVHIEAKSCLFFMIIIPVKLAIEKPDPIFPIILNGAQTG
ncbi:hypothetical protein CRP01_21415 [Flavilitoribacter nigricans DSM 23189 = NBRC 102662]|uniref:Uncharacterized protein n=1 Tax=Flavilitoribacter nigricans (strain ATCC 23147 / DSM 23189 / NBRC 102662 / NCIMB 1420 / SS-2) TaxID=1122177 RepID=A0A2D0N845_FLAN2|nr:hypothetical protein CRP01_21415 [Flavilitoribacter nigricans DSM 23189 = NBRC 102662]